MSDIFAPWRRFWGLPWLWKGPILGLAGLVVLVAAIVVASGGGDDGTGSAAGEKATRTSPTATASRSPSASASPAATPSEATPAPEATEPVEPPPIEGGEGELPGVVTPPPVISGGGGMPGPGPQPSPPPPPPPGLSDEDLATLYQFDYCEEAWWMAARLEIQVGLMAQVQGGDVTQYQQDLQAITDYLNQTCVGIGAKAGAIPGIGASRCESARKSANMVMFWGEMVRYLGGGPSIEFATRELTEFQAAAGCPAST